MILGLVEQRLRIWMTWSQASAFCLRWLVLRLGFSARALPRFIHALCTHLTVLICITQRLHRPGLRKLYHGSLVQAPPLLSTIWNFKGYHTYPILTSISLCLCRRLLLGEYYFALSVDAILRSGIEMPLLDGQSRTGRVLGHGLK